MDEKELAEIEKRLEYFDKRRDRARQRLKGLKGNYWHFAIIGLKTDLDYYSFARFGHLQKVVEPPGEVELAQALTDLRLMSPVGRYSHNIGYELSLNRDFGDSEQGPFNMAWWILSGLRVKTLAEILVPAVADYSWSTISALENHECHINLLEDVPSAARFEEPVEVSSKNLDWVFSNLVSLIDLLEDIRFRIAVESLCTHQHVLGKRMMVAQLWAGIEALFGISQELRFRLATYVATNLEPRGASRKELFKRILRLYDTRSKAVHGGKIRDVDLKSHIVEVRKVLSRLLCTIVEAGKIPDQEIIEDQLFS